MPVIDFDPLAHGAFVYSTFAKGARVPRSELNQLLRRGMRCCVEVGQSDPSLLIGFAVAAGQTVAWVYVKPKARGVGKAWRMLDYLNVDTQCPMLALFESPACDGMQRDGKPITYAFELDETKEIEDAERD